VVFSLVGILGKRKETKSNTEIKRKRLAKTEMERGTKKNLGGLQNSI
jgi:hypothetical protein